MSQNAYRWRFGAFLYFKRYGICFCLSVLHFFLLPVAEVRYLPKAVIRKAADPWKEDTGLFFFRGEPDGKAAICNAGGGFAYVGAM